MNPVVHALRLKTKRAETHRLNFKTAVGLGVGTERRPTTYSFHSNAEGYPVYTTDIIEPGPEAAILLGEFIHQMRSTLDHLACQFVFQRTKNPADRELSQFPIFECPTKFKDHKLYGFFRKRLGPASDEFAAILDAQPYNRHPNAPTTDPLYYLTKLDNIDKHRAILVLNTALSYEGHIFLGSTPQHFVKRKHPIKAGANVLDIGMALPQPPPRVNVERWAPYIVFLETDGTCDNLSVFPILKGITDAVNTVINDFERFFP